MSFIMNDSMNNSLNDLANNLTEDKSFDILDWLDEKLFDPNQKKLTEYQRVNYVKVLYNSKLRSYKFNKDRYTIKLELENSVKFALRRNSLSQLIDYIDFCQIYSNILYFNTLVLKNLDNTLPRGK